MEKGRRILSIDVMRGLTLFLMLFVNDLYVPGVPAWLAHRPADFDGMGLADWVFPGFLFMVGMAVPFAIQSRIKRGESQLHILVHIVIRTISLLIIGVIMVNLDRLNAELTGIPKNLWAILAYIAVFLIWNNYPDSLGRIASVLKIIGISGLVVLLALYRSGTAENPGWLITSWWGILGLIGWGYLVTSLTYLWIKENILWTAAIWFMFIGLNIFGMLNLLDFLAPIKPVFGVIIDGNVPSIVMSGLFFSLILRKYKTNQRAFVKISLVTGMSALGLGFVLRNWFIISKILGTPSWAMICNGISILMFAALFKLIDINGKTSWTALFRTAGQNSLTTYLAPDVIYYSIWMSGIPLLFYKNAESVFIIIVGSLIWSFLMILFAKLLSDIGIRLKL